MSNPSHPQPVLSICIPAYNRPKWLRRAILSILKTPATQQVKVEIVVSDDSTITGCKQLVEQLLKQWQGDWQYQQNSPSLGMAANWNQSIRMATGQYVLVLHDDDYLEPDAVSHMLRAISDSNGASALLFGVNIVTETQRIRKRQIASDKQYLDSISALELLLTDSSFIRFPGIVVKTCVFEKVGYFDESIGEVADIHMWVRICHKCGLLRIPVTTANYTVHSNALTMNMFTSEVVKSLERIFDDVLNQKWINKELCESCKSRYFHQFVLAGTVRFLRSCNLLKAQETFLLLRRVDIQYGLEGKKWMTLRNMIGTFLKIVSLLPFKAIR